MKIYLFILSLITLFTQNLKSQIVLDSNSRGFEGIVLGKATKNEIIKQFGRAYKKSIENRKVFAYYRDNRRCKMFEVPAFKVLDYAKSGVKFKFDIETDTLERIVFVQTSKTTTSKNIQINQHSITDVILAYENAQNPLLNLSNTHLRIEENKIQLRYSGIIFISFCPKATEANQDIIMNAKIHQIEIF